MECAWWKSKTPIGSHLRAILECNNFVPLPSSLPALMMDSISGNPHALLLTLTERTGSKIRWQWTRSTARNWDVRPAESFLGVNLSVQFVLNISSRRGTDRGNVGWRRRLLCKLKWNVCALYKVTVFCGSILRHKFYEPQTPIWKQRADFHFSFVCEKSDANFPKCKYSARLITR